MGDATMVLLDFLTEPLREGISTEGTLAPEPLSIPSLSFSLFPLGGDGDLSKYWCWRPWPGDTGDATREFPREDSLLEVI